MAAAGIIPKAIQQRGGHTRPPPITGDPLMFEGACVLDTGAGRLHLLSPTSGADPLSLAVGSVTRFATPALYANSVFVGTMSGIRAFNR